MFIGWGTRKDTVMRPMNLVNAVSSYLHAHGYTVEHDGGGLIRAVGGKPLGMRFVGPSGRELASLSRPSESATVEILCDGQCVSRLRGHDAHHAEISRRIMKLWPMSPDASPRVAA
jgi:hypothetical protein